MSVWDFLWRCRFQGDVKGSLEDFDNAYNVLPSLRPFLWQRGLSLYYENKFEEGSEQFRQDVGVNPNDSEEVCNCCQVTLCAILYTSFVKSVSSNDLPVLSTACNSLRLN